METETVTPKPCQVGFQGNFPKGRETGDNDTAQRAQPPWASGDSTLFWINAVPHTHKSGVRDMDGATGHAPFLLGALAMDLGSHPTANEPRSATMLTAQSQVGVSS